MIDLIPLQRRFLRAALAPDIRTAALSIPRGNGKSTLAGKLVTDALTPGHDLFHAGAEYVLCAGSLEQARFVFRPARAALEPTGEYSFLDSQRAMGIRHKPSGTRLRVQSSNAKTAMGLVNTPLLIADEPGAWEVAGGELMFDAISTAMGKPDSPLRAVFIGTLAPATAGWWHDLIADGSRGSTHVTALQGDPERWDQWPEIRRCNPLVAKYPEGRAVLIEERDAARADTRLKARFMSYRLNIPTADEATTLLTVDDWKQVEAREVPPAHGPPLFAYDLGGGRAWSAAVAMWQSGRTEALALAPGIPDLAAQEKRDRVPAGTYQRLAQLGVLHVADGLRVQPVGMLHNLALRAWGQPVQILCDRFRLPDLQDSVKGIRIIPRVTRWSEASADIRALRKLCRDGPLAVADASRPLIAASLAVSRVKNDDAGSMRLLKDGSNNTARDDVAAALTLAAGSYTRSNPRLEMTG